MGASYRESPHSFREALRVVGEILSSNHELIHQGTLVTETEQIVVAAFKKCTGVRLSRLELVTRLDDRFPGNAGEQALIMAGVRAEGRPLQYAIGYQTFLEHEYLVGPGVLVPRPETEVLVREVMERIISQGKEAAALLGLEVGIGSGAISVELLARFPALRMIATELTSEARAYAERNAEAILGSGWKSRLELRTAKSGAEVLEPFKGGVQADFLVSNPPYLSDSDEIALDVKLHEPSPALYAPKGDPLHFYRKISEGARALLQRGGWVALETPHERASEVRELFSAWKTETILDLAGRERALIAT